MLPEIEILLKATRFEHKTLKNSDKTPLRARRNGANKLWKTRPNEFKIPCKYGLYDYFYIDQNNYQDWTATN